MKLKELLEDIKGDTLLYLVNADESKVLCVDEARFMTKFLDTYVNEISLSSTEDGIQIRLEYND